MVEAIAETDDKLLEKYLSGEEITDESSRRPCAARRSPIACSPVLCGSAFKNKGVQPLLDAVVDYLPSPVDIPAGAGPRRRAPRRRSSAARGRRAVLGLVFKIMSDPFVGQLAFFRVYSGTLESGTGGPQRDQADRTERIGRLLKMHANKREEITRSWRATSRPPSA